MRKNLCSVLKFVCRYPYTFMDLSKPHLRVMKAIKYVLQREFNEA